MDRGQGNQRVGNRGLNGGGDPWGGSQEGKGVGWGGGERSGSWGGGWRVSPVKDVTIFDLSQETEKEEAKMMTVENLFQHSSVPSNPPAKYFKLDAHILYVNMAENAAQTVEKQVLSLPRSTDLVSTGADQS